MSDARARRRAGPFALVAVFLLLGAGALAWRLRFRTGDAIPSEGHGGGGGGAAAPATLPEGEGSRLAADPRRPDAPAMGAPPVAIEVTAAPTSPTDLPTWKDVRFALVDAVTGRPLDGRAVASPPTLALGGESARTGPGAQARLRVVAAPGYVAWEPAIHRFAPDLVTAGISLVYPLHRTIDLELTVVDEQQRPTEGASVISVGVDRRRWGGEVEDLGGGRFRLHDLPFVPHGRVAVELTWAPEGTTVAEPVDAGSVTGEGAAWSGRMPDLHAPGFSATATLRGGRIQEVPSSLTEDDSSEASPARGSIHVRVLRRDGARAVGVRVRADTRSGFTAKPDGTFTFTRARVGTCAVSLADPVLVPTTVTVDVREGETTEVELVEPDPAMLEVTVVDGDGKPVPVARVEVVTPSDMPALDLVDGILRIDPYTDELGRRSFTRVEAGPVTVRAWGHGGMGEAQVTLRPGARSSVTLVVK